MFELRKSFAFAGTIGAVMLGSAILASGGNSALAAGSHSGGHNDAHTESSDTGHGHASGQGHGAGHGSGHGGGHGDGHGGGHHASTSGEPGKAEDVTRTIEVTLYDNYYEPEKIDVKDGETVRFVIRNAGDFLHEFSIATENMHIAHQPEMMMMMEQGVLEATGINLEAAQHMMETMGHGMHEEGNSVLVEPGDESEIIWRFTEREKLQFACNIPGHYDAGMVGDFRFAN